MKILKFDDLYPNILEKAIKTVHLQKERLCIVTSSLSDVENNLIESVTLALQGNKEYISFYSSIENNYLDVIQKTGASSHNTYPRIKELLNQLSETLHAIFLVKDATTKVIDFSKSLCKKLVALVLTNVLSSRGFSATYLDPSLLIKTDSTYGDANVFFDQTYQNIQAHFKPKNTAYIIAGGIGSTLEKSCAATTLGLGGANYTASIFSAALKASSFEIWTRQNGFTTADPNVVPDAFSIDSLSYEEAIEMSHFGSSVLHPQSILSAMKQNIPITIKNIDNLSFKGTSIQSKQKKNSQIVRGISSVTNTSLIRIQAGSFTNLTHLGRRVFQEIEKLNIQVILTTQGSSKQSICIAVFTQHLEKAINTLKKEFIHEIKLGKIEEISSDTDATTIAVVGDNMRNSSGVAGRLFQALGQNGINIIAISQGSSERNISTIIRKNDRVKALNIIHQAFFLSSTKTVNIFLVGTGLIGKTLLKLLSNYEKIPKEKKYVQFRLVGIARRKKMNFFSRGLPFHTAVQDLEADGTEMNIESFFEQMLSLNLPNSIFIDCTASEDVAFIYHKILDSNISIVTPNKRACSGDYSYYKKLKMLEKKRGVKFLYETNVGAGLPIIRTLNDILASGDKILKIEAVLSGSMSFIFNSFVDKKKFSTVVREAREKGYTEPDPREDLSGMDVARKILILARELGSSIDIKDIPVESLITESCLKAPSIDDFFQELQKMDHELEKRKGILEKNNEKLRFIATYEKSKAFVKLQSVSSNHPFSALGGSDNIVSFTTEMYRDRQLVIQGPGAGAEVTAAGVFADVMFIANYLL